MTNPEQPQGNILWRWTKAIGVGIYYAAYNTGGFFAELFGITTPRYDYVLREYRERERRRAEEEARLAAASPDAIEDPIHA